MSVEIGRVPAPAAILGECPLWNPAEKALYWVDIDGRCINRYKPTAGSVDTRHVAGRPGSIALTAETGRLLVAVEHEICFLDWSTSELTPWVELEAPHTGNRLNDGRCDPAGRFVVGSMFADVSASRQTGALYQIDSSGRACTLRERDWYQQRPGFRC